MAPFVLRHFNIMRLLSDSRGVPRGDFSRLAICPAWRFVFVLPEQQQGRYFSKDKI